MSTGVEEPQAVAGEPVPPAPERTTYLVVDGENIDATLGNSVLGRRPTPAERPRWDTVLAHAERHFGQPVKGLFFLNASNGALPMSFVSALLAMRYRPVPLSGPPTVKVVDEGILRTLAALQDRPGDVLLASHDGDFLEAVTGLLDGGGHRVALLGFREFVHHGFAELAGRGLELLDLETAVGAFTVPLPRVRIIPLEEFDPLDFL